MSNPLAVPLQTGVCTFAYLRLWGFSQGHARDAAKKL